MLAIPAPAALDGVRLRAQLADAGIVLTVEDLHLVDGRLYFPTLTDEHRGTVEAAVNGHMSRPAAPDPDAEFRKALEGATTVAQIRDALLGKTGPGAEPRRPDGR